MNWSRGLWLVVSLIIENNGRGDPAPTMVRYANRAGRPRPYDGKGFLGLRGLCVVGIVYCLNQDFQDWERSIHIPNNVYYTIL